MGKFKTIFAACLGLGVAAGAGYYLYRRFSSKDGRNEDASLTQVKKNRKTGTNPKFDEKADAQNDEVGTLTKDTRTKDNSLTVPKVDSFKFAPSKEENQSHAEAPAVAKGEDESTNATKKREYTMKSDVVMDTNRNNKNSGNSATVPKIEIDSMKVVLQKEQNQSPADEPAVAKRESKSTAARRHKQPAKKKVRNEKSNFGGLKKGFLL